MDNVHFIPNFNLLWDAAGKCLELVSPIGKELPCQPAGWRKYQAWRKQLKAAAHRSANRSQSNARNTPAGLNAVMDY